MKTRDFHLPGRSPVYAREGMAATSHPLASLAAISTLKAGGTAADAAVAAVAVLCVVEPAMTGIGGDCFCLIAKPGQQPWGYNGSGRAAAAVTTEKLLAQGMSRKIAATSPHAVTVPGAVEAWEQILKAHGKFGLDRVLRHAIGYAEDGFVIAPRVGSDWAKHVDKLKPHAGSAKYYLPNGGAPEIGSTVRLAALAATLKAIASGGAKAFYEGPIAADIAATVQAAGGFLAVEDLARMAVSFINSLYAPFGTGICTEKTGIMLHNRGTGFVVEPGHPNTIEAGKRPMHTLTPALAMRGGRCAMSFGVMGADYQPMGHTHVVSNMVDYGMDVQAAIDAPRMFYGGEVTLVGRGIPAAAVAGLKALGHSVELRPAPWGGGQAIVIDWERGILIGGSDPRKDGCAIGY